jgi:hypothetical protein
MFRVLQRHKRVAAQLHGFQCIHLAEVNLKVERHLFEVRKSQFMSSQYWMPGARRHLLHTSNKHSRNSGKQCRSSRRCGADGSRTWRRRAACRHIPEETCANFSQSSHDTAWTRDNGCAGVVSVRFMRCCSVRGAGFNLQPRIVNVLFTLVEVDNKRVGKR